eukprot:8887308-Pyramimonas_sp.AAC.1
MPGANRGSERAFSRSTSYSAPAGSSGSGPAAPAPASSAHTSSSGSPSSRSPKAPPKAPASGAAGFAPSLGPCCATRSCAAPAPSRSTPSASAWRATFRLRRSTALGTSPRMRAAKAGAAAAKRLLSSPSAP